MEEKTFINKETTPNEKKFVPKIDHSLTKKYAEVYKSIYDSEEEELNDAIAMLDEIDI